MRKCRRVWTVSSPGVTTAMPPPSYTQLVLATQLFVYFVHIHPFLDGNGRVGRVLMADYLIRQGDLPVVFRELEREHYIKMVSDAQDGEPDDLCEAVALTPTEMLVTISR